MRPRFGLGKTFLLAALLWSGGIPAPRNALAAPGPSAPVVSTGSTTSYAPARARRLDLLGRINRETRTFYRQLRRSLVRVKLDPDPLDLLPRNMRTPFERWRRRWIIHHHFRARPKRSAVAPKNTPTIIITPEIKYTAHPQRTLNATQRRRLRFIAHKPRVELFLIRQFRIARHLPPRQRWPLLRLVMQRIHTLRFGARQSVLGVVVGRQKRVLVLELLGPPGKKLPVTLTTADGKTIQADILGMDYAHAMTILSLPPSAELPGVRLARRLPRPVHMLLAINTVSPSLRWCTPLQSHRSDRIRGLCSFPTGDEGPEFFFNLHGELAALTVGSHALGLSRHVGWFTEFVRTGRIRGWKFGIGYLMLPRNSPLRKKIRGIDDRPAMLVQKVFEHSAAKRGGIRPGDIILAIAGLPVDNLAAIVRKARANPSYVPVVLIRNGRVLRLHIRLRGGRGPGNTPAR